MDLRVLYRRTSSPEGIVSLKGFTPISKRVVAVCYGSGKSEISSNFIDYPPRRFARILRQSFQRNRLLCGVFVQIRQIQNQFQHPVALIRLWLIRVFFQILHRRQSVRKQPVNVLRIQPLSRAATRHRLIRAHKRFVQKMIQAHVPFRQGKRHRFRTSETVAIVRRSHVRLLSFSRDAQRNLSNPGAKIPLTLPRFP